MRRPVAPVVPRPPTPAIQGPEALLSGGIERARAASGIAAVNEVGQARFDRVEGGAGLSAFASDRARPQGLTAEVFSFVAPTSCDCGVLRADRQQAALELIDERLARLDGSVAVDAARVIREALRSLVELGEIQNSLIRG